MVFRWAGECPRVTVALTEALVKFKDGLLLLSLLVYGQAATLWICDQMRILTLEQYSGVLGASSGFHFRVGCFPCAWKRCASPAHLKTYDVRSHPNPSLLIAD